MFLSCILQLFCFEKTIYALADGACNRYFEYGDYCLILKVRNFNFSNRILCIFSEKKSLHDR